MNPLIKVDNVYFSYSRKPILTGLDMAISEGEIVTLLGPNGCGKSTLIKIIVGVLQPLAGKVSYKGYGYRPLRSEGVGAKDRLCSSDT